MNRQTRKAIKTDKFAQEVGHTFEFLSEHSSETKRYGLIGLAVVLIVGSIYYYTRHQATARELALATAMTSDPVLNQTPDNSKMSPADQEKARVGVYSPLAAKYHGSQEGAIGGFLLAAVQADKGNYAEAEKLFKDVMDSAPSDYASVARVSLAEVYFSEGKAAEGEKLLRYQIDHPTALVSKEAATLALASLLGKTNPTEARKLLAPLTTTRTAISRLAITEMGNLPQAN